MFNKILVVLDATQPQSCVFTIALAYAKLFQAEVLLLHNSPASPRDCFVRDEINQPALAKLRSLQKIATGMGLSVDFAQFNGQTEQNLWRFSQQWSPDLILIDPNDFCEDSETLQSDIIYNAPCSVLLVHRPQENKAISMRMILKRKQEYDTKSAREQLEAMLALTPD